MSKYAARIEIGWFNDVFEGDEPWGIIAGVEGVQDFGCLMGMGRSRENAKGQKELDKLEKFLQKYYSRELTMEDIKGLNIKLSIGNIICHGVAEGDEEIAKL